MEKQNYNFRVSILTPKIILILNLPKSHKKYKFLQINKSPPITFRPKLSPKIIKILANLYQPRHCIAMPSNFYSDKLQLRYSSRQLRRN